jgi:hypothetical protein
VIDEKGFQRSNTALVRSTGFEVLLASVEREEVDVLSGSAALAWELLAEPTTTSALAVGLAEYYSIPASAIDADVRRLLEDLQSRGWIQEDAGRD